MIAEFGATPWGRAWLGLAERSVSTIDTRLPVARRLSRRGAVSRLDLAPGRVTGTVTHGKHQEVCLAFPTWTRKQRATATTLIGAHPLASRFLTFGEAPDDLAANLAAAGVPIAPRPGQVTVDCSCNELRKPCLHALVCCYALVQRLDEEPALTLSVQGHLLTPPGEAMTFEAWIPLDGISAATFFQSRATKQP